MKKIQNLPRRIAKSELGVTGIEYALAAALIGGWFYAGAGFASCCEPMRYETASSVVLSPSC